jgi:CheY-like chemotaxis protein
VTIKNHGGFIAVNSKVGAGTTITLHLPLAADQPQPDTAAAPSEQTALKRILIVEDEDMIRTMIADMLSDQGYCVSVCSGGREAVDYMHDHPGEVDVAIVDIIMPDMTGAECISTLRRMDPRIKFIVATGAGGTDTQTLLRGDRIVGLVRKPFDEDDLLRVIGAA